MLVEGIEGIVAAGHSRLAGIEGGPVGSSLGSTLLLL